MIFFMVTGLDAAASKMHQKAINEDLFARIGRDDKAAFEELFVLTERAVYAMALSILKDPYDTQDVVQETYLKIRSAAHLYKPMGKPLAWILTITKNLALNTLRKSAHGAVLQENPPDNDLRYSCVCDPTDRLVLSAALNILNEEEREILLLHLVSGIKHIEIARTLKAPISTVISRYHRALKKLRKHLTEKGAF
ncbi:MAG: RNA polymerase sigma factor [Oscillospiraceae bacterium]